MFFQRMSAHMTQIGERVGNGLRTRFGIWGLALISFIESALVVPILTDPFLVAYILANRSKVVSGVLVTIIASVIGGLFAYFSAAGFFEIVVAPYLSADTIAEIRLFASQFTEGIFLLTFLGALTPIPYTLVAVAAGMIKGNVLVFILASLIGRSLRYGILGWLTHRFGERALRTAHAHLHVVVPILIIAAIAYIAYKFFLSGHM